MSQYIIEGNIDFYKALKEIKEIKTTDDKNKKDNTIVYEKNDFEKTCLIEHKQLEERFIRLPCLHSFNYKPLYTEITQQKCVKNSLSIDHLGLYEIKCPYCRTKHKCVLPYYDDLSFNKVSGVNWPNKYALKMFKCKYVYKSGKKKGEMCNKESINCHCKTHELSIKSSIKKKEEKICCNAIIKSGANKGKQCSCKAIVNGFCKRHNN